MDENTEQKRKRTFWSDVLRMVRLLAVYFVLYFASIFLLGLTPLRDSTQLVGIFAFVLPGIVTYFYLPPEQKGFVFQCKRRLAAVCGILLLAVGCTILCNHLLSLIPWDSILPESLQLSSEGQFEIPAALALFGYGFLAPFAEEVCFRGALFGSLRKWMKKTPAILISALLFALYHGNVIQGIYAFFMGAVMAFLVDKTGALWASILFHITANTLVTAYSLYPSFYDFWVSLSGKLAAAACLPGGIVLLILSFSKKDPKDQKKKESGL